MEVRVQQSTLQKERRFPSRSELALADMRGPKLTDELPDSMRLFAGPPS